MPSEPSAVVLADSISPQNKRLTTFEINTHRFILAEINTHCMLARNYRSSRAVPTLKLLDEVRENPAYPVEWRKDIPGMGAGEPMTHSEMLTAKAQWKHAACDAAYHAQRAHDRGLDRQWVNRMVEPYLWVPGVISGVEWENFFALRTSTHAQPEFKVLANLMLGALRASTPKPLEPGQWHLPYIDDEDIENVTDYFQRLTPDYASSVYKPLDLLKLISAARCARVTYKVFHADRKSNINDDQALAQKLLKDVHMSPFEHQATPDQWIDRQWTHPLGFVRPGYWAHENLHAKFPGWIMNRKTIVGESQSFEI